MISLTAAEGQKAEKPRIYVQLGRVFGSHASIHMPSEELTSPLSSQGLFISFIFLIIKIVDHSCCSVTQLCPTLCDPMDCSTSSFLVLHHLLELAQTHPTESVMSSNHLVLCHPLLLLPSILPIISVFSNGSVLHMLVKVLELHLQYQSFQWIFRTDFLYDGLVGCPCSPRDSQESSPTSQFKSIISVLSYFYGPTLTFIHDYWKNHSLDYMNLCQQSKVSGF